MTYRIPRRLALQAGLTLGASIFLPQARACEFFTRTLRILHPWTRATAMDATSAILCMTFDEVLEDDRLVGVETPVAPRAELVIKEATAKIDVAIPAGRETRLAEDGTYIRLVDLAHPLLIARSYPLKLHFEKGGAVNALLNVDYLRSLSPA